MAAQWVSGLNLKLFSFEQQEKVLSQVENTSQETTMQLSIQNDQNSYIIQDQLPQITDSIVKYSLSVLEFLKQNDFTGDDNGKVYNIDQLIYIFDFEIGLYELIKQIIMLNPYLSQATQIDTLFTSIQILTKRQNKMYAFIKANNMPIIRSGTDKVWVKFTPQVVLKSYTTFDEIQGIIHGYLLSQMKR